MTACDKVIFGVHDLLISAFVKLILIFVSFMHVGPIDEGGPHRRVEGNSHAALNLQGNLCIASHTHMHCSCAHVARSQAYSNHGIVNIDKKKLKSD